MNHWSFLLSFLLVSNVYGQTKIVGRVFDADSNAVPSAKVNIPGLTERETDAEGYFEFEIPQKTQESHLLKGGVDLQIEVEKEGMVVIDPRDLAIRLAHNWTYQKPHEIYLCRKGALACLRSERMLNYVLREKIQAAIETKEQEFARRDVLAEEALRLGVSKDTLQIAVIEYKDRLRTSTDLYLRGLAFQDDAEEAKDYKIKQEKSDEAEKYFRGAITKAERAIRQGEEEKQRVPEYYNSLGLNLFDKARYDSAAFYFAKADSMKPNDADRLNMWGLALFHLAAYDKAMQKFQSAYTIDSTAYGPNHTEVASRLNNIGEVLRAKGDYARALAKYNEALAIVEKSFGREHPNVATGLNNVGEVLSATGDYDGALAKYNEALAIFEKCCGREHPNVATGLNNVGEVLRAKGDYDGALAKYNEALAIFEKSFGREHPNVATGLNNIAVVLEAKGDYDAALAKYHEALAIDERYFGRNHPNVATRLNNVAVVLEAKGDYAEALKKYDKALAICTQFLGPDHPNTKTVAASRVRVLQSFPATERWRYLTQSYLAQLSDTLLQNDRLALLLQIGQGYFKQAKADSALIYVEQALQLAQKLNDQEMVGTILNNVGLTLKSLRRWPESERFLRRSAEHHRKVQGDSAAVLAYTYFHLAGVAQAEGQTPLSREYAQKSLALAEHHKLAELREQVQALLQEIAGKKK